VFTVIALLLIPLQLRFRALWLVLSALYLNAVVVSLTAGRFRMRVRWALLATWVLALALRIAPVAEPEVATLLYVTSRILVVVLLGGCVAAALHYVLHGAEISIDRIFASIVAYMLLGLGFAAAYQVIVAVTPESFALPATTGGANELERLEVQLTYFSLSPSPLSVTGTSHRGCHWPRCSRCWKP
jgi:hypothetical protein